MTISPRGKTKSREGPDGIFKSHVAKCHKHQRRLTAVATRVEYSFYYSAPSEPRCSFIPRFLSHFADTRAPSRRDTSLDSANPAGLSPKSSILRSSDVIAIYINAPNYKKKEIPRNVDVLVSAILIFISSVRQFRFFFSKNTSVSLTSRLRVLR